MAKANILGHLDQFIRVNTKKAINMDTGSIWSLMEVAIRATGSKEDAMEKVFKWRKQDKRLKYFTKTDKSCQIKKYRAL